MKTKNMIKGMACGAALLVSASAVQATVISQTKTFDGIPGFSSILNFNQFDDNGGTYTLNSIQVTVQLNTDAGASLRIDNDGAAPASGTTEFGSDGIIFASDVNLTKTDTSTFNGALQSTTSKFMSLAADD